MLTSWINKHWLSQLGCFADYRHIAESPTNIRIYFRAYAGDSSLPLARPAVFDAPA